MPDNVKNEPDQYQSRADAQRDRDAEPGCPTVDGTRMLLHRFCGQIELPTGKPAPLDAMDTALLKEMERTA